MSNKQEIPHFYANKDSFRAGRATPSLGIELLYPLTPFDDGRGASFDGIVREIRAMLMHTFLGDAL